MIGAAHRSDQASVGGSRYLPDHAAAAQLVFEWPPPLGMAVTGVGHPDPAGEIEQLSSIGGVQVGPFSPLNVEISAS